MEELDSPLLESIVNFTEARLHATIRRESRVQVEQALTQKRQVRPAGAQDTVPARQACPHVYLFGMLVCLTGEPLGMSCTSLTHRGVLSAAGAGGL